MMAQKNIFLLFICALFCYGCASVEQTETLKKEYSYRENIAGPKGTDISSIYDRGGNKIGFTAKITENIGLSRTKSEAAQGCYALENGDDIAWEFQKLQGTKNFRSPIDLITLFDGDQILFRQRKQDNVSWNDYPLNDVIIPLDLYLDRQNASYHLTLMDNLMHFKINDENYSFAIDDYKTLELCLGLHRLELLRWTGQVVPAQALNVIIK